MNRILLLIAMLVLGQSWSQAAWGQEPVAATTLTASIDRPWYLAGEALTINVTATDPTDDLRTGALIVYAELCDTHRLAAGTVIFLNRFQSQSKEGYKGTGIMELPADLHSGYYVLSVYTRHAAQVTQQLIAVVNPLHKSADDDIQWVLGDRCWVTTTTEPGSMTTQKHIDERETEGLIIKARVKNVYDGHTFSGSEILPSLSIIGKQIHYFEGRMVNDTIAVFYTYGIHGRQPLVLSALSSTDVSLPIEMTSPFATLLPRKLPHLVFHYNRSEVEARSLDMQRHQIAITPPKREIQLGDDGDDAAEIEKTLDYDETAYGTTPDLSYNLDEYRQFLTIREVLLEYVNCVRNTKIDGQPQLIVRKPDTSFDSSRPSLVLIDGMPVFNIERLLNYDARRVHYINIYGGQYTFGNGIYNGILSFVTRSGRLTNYRIEPNMQYLVYDFP